MSELRYIPLVKCESCLKEYAQTEIHRVREDDEGAYWNLCEACYLAVEETFDSMEG